MSDGLQLADMNGDGLLDAVLVRDGVVAYQLNLGHGRWSQIIEMQALTSTWEHDVSLVDVTGDGLADLVTVLVDRVLVAINRNGRRFDLMTISSAQTVEGLLPERDSGTQVRFADMNGSGSTDIVWLEATGRVRYLELFATRPHLLARVENGLGRVTTIRYGSSAEHLSRSGGPGAWNHHLAIPMLTVDEIQQWEMAGGVPQVSRFQYRDGYYDGRERQFRGFGSVTVTTDGDPSTEPGRVDHTFELGVDDPYLHGKPISVTRWSRERVLSVESSTWRDPQTGRDACSVAGAEHLVSSEVPVRFVCQTESTIELREGRPAEEWVVLQEVYSYDAYGNRTRVDRRGVVSVGGAGCEPCTQPPGSFGKPCNSLCLGDESFQETVFVSPDATGGRWILNKPCVVQRFADPTSAHRSHHRTYYDGPAFEGLQLCTLSKGAVTRTSARTSAYEPADFIDIERFELNPHGLPITLMDPDGHRRRIEYDADGLLPRAEEIVFDGPWRDQPYRLRVEVDYHPVLDKVIAASSWMRRDDGVSALPPSARRETRYTYDVFGRLTRIAKPGDTLDRPTQEFAYELGQPTSRIVTRTRSISGSAPDMESVQCFDGLGRKLQERTLIRPGLYQVSGFTTFSSRGEAERVFQPYHSTSGLCESAPRSSDRFLATRFDASGRALSVTLPDAETFGSTSIARTEYLPLGTRVWDEEDTDPTSEHFGTYTETLKDGLDRVVRTTRMTALGVHIGHDFTYDGLGAFEGWIDARGNRKRQHRDLLGRIDRVEDPDSGTTTLTYDGRGRVVRRVDGAGRAVISHYDEAGRRIEQWEDGRRAETLRRSYFDHHEHCPLPAGCRNAEGLLVATEHPGLDGENRDFLSYDSRGRLIASLRHLEGEALSFEMSYDNADRVSREVLPGGRELRRVYDGLGRLSRFVGILDARYDERGDLSHVVTVNGLTTQYTYDATRQLASTRVDLRDQTLISLSHERLRTGHFVADVDHLERSRRNRGVVYELDALYRLRAAHFEPTGATTGPVDAESVQYDFDELDNLVAIRSTLPGSRAHVGAFDFGAERPHAPQRLHLSVGASTAFEYDGAGRTTRVGELTHRWTADGLLAEVAQSELVLGRYTYDAGGARAVAREGSVQRLYAAPNVEIARGIATVHLDLLGTRRAIYEYPYQRCADEGCRASNGATPHAGAIWNTRTASGPEALRRRLAASAGAHWLGQRVAVSAVDVDPVGVTRLVVDADGRLVSETQSYPYGEVRWHFGHQDRAPALFGHQRDRTGYVNAGARLTSTQFARWLSPDPAFEVLDAVPNREAVNRWLLVEGNPTSRLDRDGRTSSSPEDVPKALDRLGMVARGMLQSTSGAVGLATAVVVAPAILTATPIMAAIGTAALVYRVYSSSASMAAGLHKIAGGLTTDSKSAYEASADSFDKVADPLGEVVLPAAVRKSVEMAGGGEKAQRMAEGTLGIAMGLSGKYRAAHGALHGASRLDGLDAGVAAIKSTLEIVDGATQMSRAQQSPTEPSALRREVLP
jgi:RHS repeat-associated protein